MGKKATRMPQAKTSGRSKYNAVKTTVDGYTFDSKREAARYGELKLMFYAGRIASLELQPDFELFVETPDGCRAPIGEYRGDFRYVDLSDMSIVVEDVKGMRTPLYRWKKKHVEAQYGIQIREIR